MRLFDNTQPQLWTFDMCKRRSICSGIPKAQRHPIFSLYPPVSLSSSFKPTDKSPPQTPQISLSLLKLLPSLLFSLLSLTSIRLPSIRPSPQRRLPRQSLCDIELGSGFGVVSIQDIEDGCRIGQWMRFDAVRWDIGSGGHGSEWERRGGERDGVGRGKGDVKFMGKIPLGGSSGNVGDGSL